MTITELHTYLEETTMVLNGKSLPGNLLTEAKSEEKERVKWEITASDYSLRLGKLEYKFSNSVMVEGEIKVQHYPDLLLFGQDGYDYLVQRAIKAVNPYLRIRYNQLLFRSGRRRNQQGQLIIDESLQLLESLVDDSHDDAWDNCHLLLNAFCLSLGLKQYKFTELAEELKKRIAEHQESFGYLSTVVSVVNDSRRSIARDLLEDIHDSIFSSIEKVIEDGDTFFGVPLIMNLCKLGDSLGRDVKVYHSACGRAYERRGDIQVEDNNNLPATGSYVKAMGWYKQAGDDERSDTLGVKYANTKDKVKLTRVGFGLRSEEIDSTENLLRSYLEHAATLGSKQLLDNLANLSVFLPATGAGRSIPEKTIYDVFNVFTFINFDINRNASVDSSSSDTDKLFQSYALEFKAFHGRLLPGIFFKGIENGTITFEIVMKYLIEETWFGHVLEGRDSNGDTYNYSWAFSLSSYLLPFFAQIEAKLLYPDLPVNFQASLEGLVLKFEPILRDLVGRLDKSTIKSSRTGVVREILLEELIEKVEQHETVNRQDVLFYKYLYTSNGKNIRNNIAHGFLRPHQCTAQDCVLVIVSLLRLGNFQFVAKADG